MSKREHSLKKEKAISSSEAKLVSKIVNSIKMGWMVLETPQTKADPFEKFFAGLADPWKYKPNFVAKRQLPIEAPKRELPSDKDSFNPAPEFAEETPKKIFSMRGLESSERGVKERFE